MKCSRIRALVTLVLLSLFATHPLPLIKFITIQTTFHPHNTLNHSVSSHHLLHRYTTSSFQSPPLPPLSVTTNQPHHHSDYFSFPKRHKPLTSLTPLFTPLHHYTTTPPLFPMTTTNTTQPLSIIKSHPLLVEFPPLRLYL